MPHDHLAHPQPRPHGAGPSGRPTPGRAGAARGPLPRAVIELTAQRLRVAAEPNRIALLEALNDGEAGVQELADRVGLPHQNVSHHLGLLWHAGILSRRSEGKMTLFAVEDWSAWWVIEQISRWAQSCLEAEHPPDPAE
jgi:DNA-binding transcriptional ArsR family regulator